ncbi:hypothetical protein C9413_07640 [Rhizobium sp. SEMIA 4085]|uniref:hypothetical protein n=1 Tax=Rhizobium TaxID=379 RepID=UPI0005866E1A|nr:MULTISPECIES: hypothetical protein [Rhizobium]NNH29380.1 hypothetical protein [Rhizobium sp. SEMIA 4085]
MRLAFVAPVSHGALVGQKAAFKILGDEERARSAFDFDSVPNAVPFYSGMPWFIPIIYSMCEATGGPFVVARTAKHATAFLFLGGAVRRAVFAGAFSRHRLGVSLRGREKR